MLDDLRTLFGLGWRRRARIYAVVAAALALCMTAIRFSPLDQSPSAAALWLGSAIGALALITRAFIPASEAQKPPAANSFEQRSHRRDHGFVPADIALGEPAEPGWVKSARG